MSVKIQLLHICLYRVSIIIYRCHNRATPVKHGQAACLSSVIRHSQGCTSITVNLLAMLQAKLAPISFLMHYLITARLQTKVVQLLTELGPVRPAKT